MIIKSLLSLIKANIKEDLNSIYFPTSTLPISDDIYQKNNSRKTEYYDIKRNYNKNSG